MIRNILAFILDILISYVLFANLLGLLFRVKTISNFKYLPTIALILLLIEMVFYFTILRKKLGQTLGRKILGVRKEDENTEIDQKNTFLKKWKELPKKLKAIFISFLILASFLVSTFLCPTSKITPALRTNPKNMEKKPRSVEQSPTPLKLFTPSISSAQIKSINKLSDFIFTKYNLESTQFNPRLSEYSIYSGDLTNLKDFEEDNKVAFSETQIDTLEKDNFFISINLDNFYIDDPNADSNRNDDWTLLYDDISGSDSIYYREPENSVFVTSDFLLHVYHRLLEKEFEYIESYKFYPKLLEISDALFNQAIFDYNHKDPDINEANRDNYQRLIAFFAVPKIILESSYVEYNSENPMDTSSDTKENALSRLSLYENDMPPESYDLATKEINLIMNQKDLKPSPIFGDLLAEKDLDSKHDYTQYKPRSHYNKNSVLRSYFRAMMWYGRNYFALNSNELTTDSILMVRLISAAQQTKNWEDIYIPTSFFVGRSDDLGIYEYSDVLSKLNIENINEDLVTQVQSTLEGYKGPQIMSTAFYGNEIFNLSKDELLNKTKGFRFMGQRFTPDAFIFTTLTQGDEKADPETDEKLPSSTTALMVMSSLGNKTTGPLIEEWANKNAPNSRNVLRNRLDYLNKYFRDLSEEEWNQNIYWGWLYTIKGLFTENLDKSNYPMFMKNEAWNKKDLQASLGSWTELKHDTLLYAKQNYAELGGGGEPPEIPPVVKGYVEPNILFLDRLITLSNMTYKGLLERELIDNQLVSRNEKFIESLKFFKDIAVKELQNEKISDEDFERLRTEAGDMEYILMPLPNETITEDGSRSALIADVHTDASEKQEILYEATGIPNYIYVAVNDINGTRLTKGLVFSYYEFTAPLGERLNDQEWRKINYTNDKSELPDMPDWTQILIK